MESPFAGNASITDLTYAFDSATWVTGEDVSLDWNGWCLFLAGHCDAFPTATYDEVWLMQTILLSQCWSYAKSRNLGLSMDEPMPDINATIANDFAVCFGVAGMFLKSTVVPMTIGMHSQLLSTPQLES